MKIEMVALEKLNPAPYNPRKITERMMDELIKSIHKFGFVEPIVINGNDTVIGGHQRLKAALELGMKQVPCYRVNLPTPEEKALNLALNKIAGDWDQDKLTHLINSLEGQIPEIPTGFSEKEIDDIIQGLGDMPEPPSTSAGRDEVCCPNCGHTF